jgi:hypothetical protein
MGFVKSCFTGIRKTTGDYLTLLDVDDWITPDAIELKADFLTRNPSFNIVRSNGVIVPDSDIDAVQSVLVERESEKTNQNIFFDLLFGRTNNYSGTYMIRSRPFFEFYKDKEIPCGQRGQYGQNLQLLLPLSLDAPSGFIDKCLFKYVRVQGSHSNQQNLDRLIDLQLGYWDIRYKMLDLMGIYDNKLRDDLRAVNYSNILNIILGYGDVERYNSYYDRLRELGRCTLEQKMYHSKLNKRPTYLFYRALFKMSRMARRHI